MSDTQDFPDLFSQASASAPLATHDLSSMKTLLDQINASADKVSKTLLRGFGAASSSGRSFNDTLTTIGQSLARLAVQEGTRMLTDGLVANLGGLFSNAFGGAGQTITPFAEGGVVASPAYFANGASVGLMGERGAEAVMPLARGPDGRLGVVSQGAGGARPLSVTVNVSAQDIDSFRRSEAQIAGALARAVARGQRSL